MPATVFRPGYELGEAMKIQVLESVGFRAWDEFVLQQSLATHCHLSGWKSVIERTYGHKGYYLMAREGADVVGVLPLVHMKSMIFGSQLVSMPFLSYGGPLAGSEAAEKALLGTALEVSSRLNASTVELRQLHRLRGIESNGVPFFNLDEQRLTMVLDMPESSEALWSSLRSKLRSQIRRPQKEGMTSTVGGAELLDDFYAVLSVNMRDLGSPVHSKRLFREILSCFGENARLGVVRLGGRPVAAGLIICFRDTIEIPWASSLRDYSRHSPNMLLYWSFLEFGCSRGFRYFDFGRTRQDKGTFRFKEQWGARPVQLYWYELGSSATLKRRRTNDSRKENLAGVIWQKFPIALANTLGPKVRGYISL